MEPVKQNTSVIKDLKLKKSASNLETLTAKKNNEMINKDELELSKNQSDGSTNKQKSYSQSPSREKKNSDSKSITRGKSVDRLSISSRRSILSRFKDRLLGRKTKSFWFEENLITKSIKILNTLTLEKFGLVTAIERNLMVPDDKIRDVKSGKILDIQDALKKSILRFISTKNNFEYIYGDSCFLYESNLYLVKYIIDQTDSRKLSLRQAVERSVIDYVSFIYFGKKGPCDLNEAMQNGLVACEVVDINLLSAIISSNVFKHYKHPLEKEQTNHIT